MPGAREQLVGGGQDRLPRLALLHGQAASAPAVVLEARVPQAVELAGVEEARDLAEQAGEQCAAAAPFAREEQDLDVAGLLGRHASSLASGITRGTRREMGEQITTALLVFRWSRPRAAASTDRKYAPEVCDHLGVHRAAAASGTDAAPPAASTDLGWSWFDTAIVVAVAVATVLVHPIHLLLINPFWLDEAWVAVLTKAPLTQLPRMSSTAPVGFVVLLRFVPGSGLQRGRLVVLGFSVLTAITAYVLARGLGWKQRWTGTVRGTVAALVVMLAPFSLVRNDLKQYTCDGFCALLLLVFGVRAERQQSRRSLIWLAVGRGGRDAVQLDGAVRRGRRVRGVARRRRCWIVSGAESSTSS